MHQVALAEGVRPCIVDAALFDSVGVEVGRPAARAVALELLGRERVGLLVKGELRPEEDGRTKTRRCRPARAAAGAQGAGESRGAVIFDAGISAGGEAAAGVSNPSSRQIPLPGSRLQGHVGHTVGHTLASMLTLPQRRPTGTARRAQQR